MPEEEIECPSCGTLVDAGEERCPICGTSIIIPEIEPVILDEPPEIGGEELPEIEEELPAVEGELPTPDEEAGAEALPEDLSVEAEEGEVPPEVEAIPEDIAELPPGDEAAPASREDTFLGALELTAPGEEVAEIEELEIIEPIEDEEILALEEEIASLELDAPEETLCPHCGAAISEYDTECPICGASLEQEVEVEEVLIATETLCPSCGEPISEEDVECASCGAEIFECPECGGLITASISACAHCGTEFEVQEIEEEGEEGAAPAAEGEEAAAEETPSLTLTKGGLVAGVGLTNGNGLGANGLGRERGLTNGLTNGLGRTNGLTNGLTNGIKVTPPAARRPSRAEIPYKKLELTVVVCLIVFILLGGGLTMLVEPPPPPAHGDIFIDGDQSDWTTIPGYVDSAGDMTKSDFNLVGYKVDFNYSADTLSFMYQVQGSAHYLQGGTLYRTYLDKDNDADTGYKIRGMGADIKLETSSGANGFFITKIHYYDDSAFERNTNWDAWASTGLADTASNGSFVELQLHPSELDIRESDTVRGLIQVAGTQNRNDFSDAVFDVLQRSRNVDDGRIFENHYGMVVEQSSAVTDNVMPIGSSNNPFIRLTVAAAGDDMTLTAINLRKLDQSSAGDTSVTVALHDGSPTGSVLSTGRLSDGMVQLNGFTDSLTAGTAKDYYVTLDVGSSASPGDAISLVVARVGAGDAGTFPVAEGTVANAYLGQASADITIDGLFDDWDPAVVKPLIDYDDDTSDPEPSANIESYCAVKSNAYASFFVEVEQDMLVGIDVPEYRADEPVGPNVTETISAPGVMVAHDAAIISWTTSVDAQGRIRYGASQTISTWDTLTLVGTGQRHTIELTGLAPSTVYWYRYTATTTLQGTVLGGDVSYTFTTAPADADPVIVSGPVVGRQTESATISWNTDEMSTTVVDYGTSNSYGATISDQNLTNAHIVSIGELSRGTTYYYRITSTDKQGNSVQVADQFETRAEEPPVPPPVPNLAEDAIYVFLDTDNDATTGYRTGSSFPVGADRMIQVTGRNGIVRNSRFFRFDGNAQINYSWTEMGEIRAGADATRMETQVAWNQLGATSPHITAYFYTKNWHGSEDFSAHNISTDVGTRGDPLWAPWFPDSAGEASLRGNENIDIAAVKLATYDGMLNAWMQMGGDLFGESDANAHTARFFFDTDNLPTSGYRLDPDMADAGGTGFRIDPTGVNVRGAIGAEYMIEVYGNDTTGPTPIMTAFLYEYTGTGEDWSWDGIAEDIYSNTTWDGDVLKTNVSLAAIGSPAMVFGAFGTQDLAGAEDYMDFIVSTNQTGGVLSVTQTALTSGTYVIKDLKESNVTSGGFVITWTTPGAEIGQVHYGTAEGALGSTVTESGPTKNHRVVILGLTNDTEYYYRITSGAIGYGDSDEHDYSVSTGTPTAGSTNAWSLNTYPLLPVAPPSYSIYGKANASGGPAVGALVFCSVGAYGPVSTYTNAGGDYSFNLGTLRDGTSTGYSASNGDMVTIWFQGVNNWTKTITAVVNGASPQDVGTTELVQSTGTVLPLSSNDNPFIDLELTAYWSAYTIDLSLRKHGYSTAADNEIQVSLYDDYIAPANLLDTQLVSSGVATFAGLGYNIPANETKHIIAAVDVLGPAVSGHAVGLYLSAINGVAVNQLASVNTMDVPMAYLDAPTADIVVDGMFADWNGIQKSDDAGGEVSNQNIEIDEYATHHDELSDALSLYLSVEGTMAAGVKVPYVGAIATEREGPAAPPPPPPELSITDWTNTTSLPVNAGVQLRCYVEGGNPTPSYNVYVNYTEHDGTPHNDVACVWSGSYWYWNVLAGEMDGIGSIDYNFWAMDNDGNSTEGGSGSIMVYDSGGGPGNTGDTVPPSISTEWTPDAAPIGIGIDVTATITDMGTGVDPSTVYIYYRLNGGGWTNALMADGGGGIFSYTIPGQGSNGTLEFYVTASDYEPNAATDPDGSYHQVWIWDPQEPIIIPNMPESSPPLRNITANATVINPLGVALNPGDVVLYYQNADSAIMTSVDMTLVGGTAVNGFWEATIPAQNVTGTVYWYVNATNGAGTNSTLDPSRDPGEITIAEGSGEGLPSVSGTSNNDTIFIYLDTDLNALTGYAPDGTTDFGADWAVIITGQDRSIVNSSYYQFNATGNAWEYAGTADSATDRTQLEVQLDGATLGLLPGDGVKAYFVVQDWSSASDSSDSATAPARVTSLSDTRFYVSWSTSASTTASILVDMDGDGDWATGAKTEFFDDIGAGTTHHMKATGLSPLTDYLFKKKIDGTEYDNGGAPWSVRTLQGLAEPPDSYVVYGTVSSLTTNDDVLVYCYLDDGADESRVLSTYTDASGQFSFNLGDARKLSDGTAFASTVGTTIYMRFDGGDEGKAPLDGTGKWIWDGTKTVSGSDPQNTSYASAQMKRTELERLFSGLKLSSRQTFVPVQDLGTFRLPGAPYIDGPKLLAPGPIPSNVMITNRGESSFSVSWTTEGSYAGAVLWGTSAGSLTNTVVDPIGGDTHHVNVGGLSAGTTYYFKIRSDGVLYGDDGSGGAGVGDPAWSVDTFAASDPPGSFTVYGQIDASGGGPSANALVYVYFNDGGGDSTVISTYADGAGNWVLNLGNARTSAGATYSSFSGTLYFKFQGAADGVYLLSGYDNVAIGTSPQDLGTRQLLDPFTAVAGQNYPDADDVADASIEILWMKIARDAGALHLYMDVETPFGNAGPDGNTYRFLIDEDQDPGTGYWIDPDRSGTSSYGYHVSGIGADYMVEVFGNDTTLQTAKLYQHSGASNDWNGWAEQASTLTAQVSGTLLYVQVPELGGVADLNVLMNAVNGPTLMDEDYGDYAISTAAGATETVQTDAAAATISGSGNLMLTIDVTARGQGAQLTDLTFDYELYTAENGIGAGTGYTVNVYTNGGATFNGVAALAGGSVNVALLTPVNIAVNATATIHAIVNVSADNSSAIAIWLSGVNTDAGIDNIASMGVARSFIDAPSTGYVVDGIFNEWNALNDGNDGLASQGVDIDGYNATTQSGGTGAPIDISNETMGTEVGVETMLHYIYGTVTDGGSPVTGATVTITNLNTSQSFTTTTDAAGRYNRSLSEMTNDYSDNHRILVEVNHNLKAGHNQTVVDTSLGGDRCNVSIVSISPHWIYGNVTDGGAPVVGATVNVTNVATFKYIETTSDGAGQYTVNIADLDSAYSDGDLIRVVAESGALGAKFYTHVDTNLGGEQVDMPLSPTGGAGGEAIFFYVSAFDGVGQGVKIPAFTAFDSAIPALPGGADTEPPVITDKTSTIYVDLVTPITVNCEVTDNVAVGLVNITWNGPAGPGNTTATPLGGDQYSWTIPAQGSPGVLNYWIWARDTSGNAALDGPHPVMVFDTGSGSGDTIPPTISHTPPGTANLSEIINITCTVTDVGAGVDSASVTLYYKNVGEGSYNTQVMNAWGTNQYSWDIGGQAVTGNVYYYIEASDLAAPPNTAVDPGAGNHSCLIIDPDIPVIDHTPPGPTSIGVSINITATVTDDSAITAVNLYYKNVGDAAYTMVAMDGPWVGDEYSYEIPAQTILGEVYYYIEATDDTANTVTEPSDAPTSNLSVEILSAGGLPIVPDSNQDLYYMLIDADMNSQTGYRTQADQFGAEYALIVAMHDRAVITARLYQYDAVADAWNDIGPAKAEGDGTQLEASVTYNDMSIGPGDQFRVFYRTVSWEAEEDLSAQNITISAAGFSHRVVNLEPDTFTVFWATDAAEDGYIEYGLTPTPGSSTGTVNADMHYHTASSLTEGTLYYYIIHSGTDTYGPYTVTTPTTNTDPPAPSYIIFGYVQDNGGGDGDNVNVMLWANGQGPISDTTDVNGNFVMNLADIYGYTAQGGHALTIEIQGGAQGYLYDTSNSLSGSPPQDLGTLILGAEENRNPATTTFYLPEPGPNGKTPKLHTTNLNGGAAPAIFGTHKGLAPTDPQNVMVTNLKEDVFSVSFTTDAASVCTVIWGTSAGVLSNTANDQIAGEDTHHFTISGLNADTDYYYKIISGGITYGDDGSGGVISPGNSWLVHTWPTPGSPPGSYTVFGTVDDTGGVDAVNTLVYVYFNDGSDSGVLSTYTDGSGNWVLNLGNARDAATGAEYSAFAGTIYHRYRGAADGDYLLGGYDSLGVTASPQDLGTRQLLSGLGVAGQNYPDPDDAPAAIDINWMKVARDGAALHLYMDVDAPFADAAPDGDTYRFLIDDDQNPNTGYWIDPDRSGGTSYGYHVSGIGADYMVEVFGNDTFIQTVALYQHSGASDDWNGWSLQASAVSASYTGTLIYAQVPELAGAGDLDVLMMAVNGATLMQEDYGDYAISTTAGGALEVVQTVISPGTIAGSDHELLQADITPRGSGSTISSLTFGYEFYSVTAGTEIGNLTVTPHYIYGYVYDALVPVVGATVTVENVDTGKSLVDTTDGAGQYTVNLLDLTTNYSDGHRIRVTATFGLDSGVNSTTVDASKGGEQCDVHLGVGSGLLVYADNGNSAFDGFGTDILLGVGTFGGGTVLVNLAPAQVIAVNATTRFFASVNVTGDDGTAIAMWLSDVGSTSGIDNIASLGEAREYINAAPAEYVVDGLFSDWTPSGNDADDISHDSTDINDYEAVTQAEGDDSIYFYVSAYGGMGTGVKIPTYTALDSAIAAPPAAGDTTPPTITDQTGITAADVLVPITINALVTDDVAVGLVNVSWSGPGNSGNTSMTFVGSDQYSYTIAAQGAGNTGVLTYSIWARDTTGNAALDGPHPVTIYEQLSGAGDTIPPTISHTPVGEAPLLTVINITCTVTDVGSSVGSVTLYYKDVGAGGYTVQAMNAWGTNQYSWDIGGQAVTGNVYYYIEAVDTAAVPNTATSPASGNYTCEIYDPDLPVIDHTPPGSTPIGVTINILATVTDDVAVTGVTLHYKNVGDAGYTTVPMNSLGGDQYDYDIPAQTILGEVYYYIEATDGGNTVFEPSDAPASNLSVAIVSAGGLPVVPDSNKDLYYLLVDKDMNAATGFSTQSDQFGAEYAVIISAHDRAVMNARLFQYNAGTDSWNDIGAAEAEMNALEMEASVNYSIMGIGAGDQFRVFYRTVSWDAEEDLTPTNITLSAAGFSHRITDLEPDTFTIHWATDAAEDGYIEYGTDLASLVSTATVNDDLHYHTANGLTANTLYYYVIHSGTDSYGPYTLTTPATSTNPPGTPYVVFGYVQDNGGGAATSVNVMIWSDGNGPVSVITDGSGNFVLNLADIYDYDPQAVHALTIEIQGGAQGYLYDTSNSLSGFPPQDLGTLVLGAEENRNPATIAFGLPGKDGKKSSLVDGTGVLTLLDRNEFDLNKYVSSGSSNYSSPNNATEANMTDVGYALAWTSMMNVSSNITWADNPASAFLGENWTANNTNTDTHLSTIGGLNASTTYYYYINQDGQQYGDSDGDGDINTGYPVLGGTPYQFTTQPTPAVPSPSYPVFGQVLDQTATPVAGATVLIWVNGAGPVAVQTDAGGNYLANLQDIYGYTPGVGDAVDIEVVGGWDGHGLETSVTINGAGPQNFGVQYIDRGLGDINVVKVVNNVTVQPGDVIIYTIYFNNTGFENATVHINDTLPAGVTYVSDTNGTNGGTWTGQWNWTFTDVQSGNNSFNITVQVDTNVPNNRVLTNDVDMWYHNTTTTWGQGNDDANITTNAGPQPPFWVFGIVYGEDGLPEANADVSIYNNETGEYMNTTTNGLGQYWLDLSNYTNGYMNGDGINVTGNTTLETGYNWTVVDTSLGGIQVDVHMLGTAPNVTISKVVNATAAVPGDQLQYTIWINNTGGQAAGVVWLNDTLPRWTSYDSSWTNVTSYTVTVVGQNVSYELYNVTVGSFVVIINVTVDMTVPAGTLTNNVTANYTNAANATEYDAGYDTADTTITAGPQPPYWIYGNVTDQYGNPIAGVNVTITNNVTGETINATTDANGQYWVDASSGWPSGYADGEGMNGTANITISGTDYYGYNSSVTNTSQGGSRMDFVLYTAAPNVTISKMANITTGSPGDAVSYTIWVNNTGTGNAGVVWVNDTMSSWFNYTGNWTNYTGNYNVYQSGNDIDFEFYNVSAGSSFVIYINGTLNDSTPDTTVVNTATAVFTDLGNTTVIPSNQDWANITVTGGGPQPPHWIYGYTTDAYGNPIAGVNVNITNNATGDSVNATSDANGQYWVDVSGWTSGYQDGDNVTGNATHPVYGTVFNFTVVNASQGGDWLNFTFPGSIINITLAKQGTGDISIIQAGIVAGWANYTIWVNITGGTPAITWVNDTVDGDVTLMNTNASSVPGYNAGASSQTNNSGTLELVWVYDLLPPGNYSFWVNFTVNATWDFATEGDQLNNTAWVNWTNSPAFSQDQTLRIANYTIWIYGDFASNILVNKSFVNLTDFPSVENPLTDGNFIQTAVDGEVLMLLIWFNNSGPNTAQDVWINDTLPLGLVYSGFNNASDLDLVYGYMTWGGLTIAGQMLSFHFQNVPLNDTGWWFWVNVSVDRAAATDWEMQNNVTSNWTNRNLLEPQPNSTAWVVIIPEFSDIAVPIFSMVLLFAIISRSRARGRKKRKEEDGE